jgi:hypothetical protein
MVGGEQIDEVLVEMQYEINKPGNQSSDDLRRQGQLRAYTSPPQAGRAEGINIS